MPEYAVYNNKLIHIDEIYKYNIEKNSNFICVCCNTTLKIKECRDGDKFKKSHFFYSNKV